VVWNETDVHVLIAEGLGAEIAQVLKVGGLRRKGKPKSTGRNACATGRPSGDWCYSMDRDSDATKS